MSKKLLSGLILSLFAVSAFAQTIVSTTPENKKVILEEFTGINCVYCPDGHAIAQGIKDANPDDVFLINIHTGSFANPGAGQPDFRTPFGPALASQSGLTGYPSGTVNRHVFSGSSTALNRGQWPSAANTIMGQSSYVNMGVEANIDVPTREMVIDVEAYYTASSPEATNMLNVALLQNRTLGPQTGGGMGNDYVHQHRLIHLVTGQWGESVSPTTATSLIAKNYSYTIPADLNGVPIELADIEVVVFMTETQQEIISGNGAYPTYTNLPLDNDVSLDSVEDILDMCLETITPVFTIQNRGNTPITSLAIDYSINGTTETYDWTGNLTAYQRAEIEIPTITYTVQPTGNTFSVELPNDEDVTNNTSEATFDQAPNGTGTVYMELNTDAYGSEVRWNVTDENGDVVYNGGPYGNNTTIYETFQLDAGCHTFNLIDTFGDGGGATTLEDSDGNIIFSTNGVYGSGVSQNFGSDGEQVLGLDTVATPKIVVYPNPATNVLNIRNAQTATVEIFDIQGKQLIKLSDISSDQEINVSTLQSGTYLVKITNGAAIKTEKLLIAR